MSYVPRRTSPRNVTRLPRVLHHARVAHRNQVPAGGASLRWARGNVHVARLDAATRADWPFVHACFGRKSPRGPLRNKTMRAVLHLWSIVAIDYVAGSHWETRPVCTATSSPTLVRIYRLCSFQCVCNENISALNASPTAWATRSAGPPFCLQLRTCGVTLFRRPQFSVESCCLPAAVCTQLEIMVNLSTSFVQLKLRRVRGQALVQAGGPLPQRGTDWRLRKQTCSYALAHLKARDGTVRHA